MPLLLSLCSNGFFRLAQFPLTISCCLFSLFLLLLSLSLGLFLHSGALEHA
jgi:hypothetical protein